MRIGEVNQYNISIYARMLQSMGASGAHIPMEENEPFRYDNYLRASRRDPLASLLPRPAGPEKEPAKTEEEWEAAIQKRAARDFKNGVDRDARAKLLREYLAAGRYGDMEKRAAHFDRVYRGEQDRLGREQGFDLLV